MVDSTGFISEQKHNRRASVIILAGTFLLLFVVANLVAGVLGAYSNQDCKAVSAGGSFGTRQVCTTTYQLKPLVLGIIVVVIIGYLAFALVTLGWSEITRSLPTSWLFYLLIPVSFMVGPLGELIVYRYLWGTNQLTLWVILRKCFMNGNLVDLSGEAYLFMWAKRNLRLTDRFILHSIKDNCVLGANASMAVLFACAAYHVDRRAGRLFSAYAVLIWIGSIHLGWHYAIDGVVAAVLTLSIWKDTGLIRSTRPRLPIAELPALAQPAMGAVELA